MRKPGKLTRREFACMAAAFGVSARLSAQAGNPSSDSMNHAPSVTGPDSLRAHGAAAGVPVGCAVVPEMLDLAGERAGGSSDPYTRTVIEQAGILVAENAMKWAALRPTATDFSFEPADKLFEFAGRFGQPVRGHNLCWHEALPSWFAATATRENAQALLVQHIQTVAGRYAGRVHSWDVVNEAVHIPDGRADGLRNSPWVNLIGPDYIEVAFATAAKADPQAKLTYNDYDIELDTPEQMAKRGRVLMLLRRLHARGVPVHAVGIQSHLQANGPQPGAGLVAFLRDVAKIGLEVYVTEMDVNTHKLEGDAAAQDIAVSAVYETYLNLILREPNVKAVLTWGITDAHTWLNESRQPWALRPDGTRQRPLPFDDAYAPTPTFFAMRGALDMGRQPMIPADITKPGEPEGNPYAPFAVPGSPAAVPPATPKLITPPNPL